MDLLAEDGDVASAVMGVAFPAGNDDFRAARDRCSQACRRFNETPEDSPGEIRSRRFLEFVPRARRSRWFIADPCIASSAQGAIAPTTPARPSRTT